MSANSYPLDFDGLGKGMSFTIEELENILGVKRSDSTRHFEFAAVSLANEIWERCGFTAKVNEYGLFILRDPEAAKHNDLLFQQDVRSMEKRQRMQAAVDVSQLSEQARAEHDRALIINSRLLQAVRREVKQIRIEQRTPNGIAAPDTEAID